MRPLTQRLFAIGLAANAFGPAPVLAVDFVCEFKVGHTLVGNSLEALQSRRNDTQERYVVTIPEECKFDTGVEAKYLNVSQAWGGSGVAFCAPGRATVVETSSSDNLFILSSFRAATSMDIG